MTALEVTATLPRRLRARRSRRAGTRSPSTSPSRPAAQDERRDADRAAAGALASCFALALGHAARKRDGASCPGCACDVDAERAGTELRYGRMRGHGARRRPRCELATLVERARRFCWVSNTFATPPESSTIERRTHERASRSSSAAVARAPPPRPSPGAWHPDLKVTLFTEFPDIAYSPCGIPFVHGREIDKFESLFLSTVERYVEDGLDMRMETTVTDIDLDRGTVTARNTHEGFDKLVDLHRLRRGRSRTCPGSNLDGLHYVKDIRAAMEFDKELDSMKRVVVLGGDADRRRDGGQPRPPRARGRLRRRGAVGAVGGARPRRRRAGPRVADQARRDAALRHPGRGVPRRRDGRVRAVATSDGRARVRRRDRLPAQAAERRAGRGRRAEARHDRRRSWSTSGCAPRSRTCGRRATSSRCRTGSRCCRSAG